MNPKGTVRLKFLLLIAVTVLLAGPTRAPSNGSTFVGNEHRDERLEGEAEEKEWVSNLVRLADKIQANGGIVKAEEDPMEPTEPPTTESTEDGVEIECAYFDETLCEKNGECDITTKVCKAENHLKTVGCLAVFGWSGDYKSNSTEPFVKVPRKQVKSLGCMQYQHADSMNCHDEKACQQGRIYRSGIGMCCCTTNNCNSVDTIEMRNPSLQDDEGLLKDGLAWPATPSSSDDVATNVAPEHNYVYIFVISCLIIIVLLGCLAVAKSRFPRIKKNDGRAYMQMDPPQDYMESGMNALVNRDLIELVEAPSDLPVKDLRLITQGRFGKVYRGTWIEEGINCHVAVKKFDEVSKQSYLHEKKLFDVLNTLPKLYPCILKSILAEKLTFDSWMIVEFHEYLSLFDLLRATPISGSMACRFILSMLDGLQFLHDDRPYFSGFAKPSIIHRDIKSKNVLVKRNMTTCIADFGLARVYDFDLVRSDLLGQVGTRRYMSPEMLEGATEFTANAFKAMDVYSMGLVVWEVLSRVQVRPNDVVPPYAIPFEEVGANPAIGYMRNHVVTHKMRPKFREEALGTEVLYALSKVTEEMWEAEAFARITAGCAFARVWDVIPLLNEPVGGVIGYLKVRTPESRIPRRPIEDLEEMVKWHSDPENLLYPTPDPFMDLPLPPPKPVINERGFTYSQSFGKPPVRALPAPPAILSLPAPPPPAVIPQPRIEQQQQPLPQQQQQQQPQPTKEEEEDREPVVDVAECRLLTQEEQARWEGEYQVEEVNTRSSTPTPSMAV